MRILSLFNEFLTKNRKTIIYILGFLFLFISFSDITFAGDPNTTTPKTQVTESKNLSELVTVLNELLKAVAVIVTFGTNIVGWFLYPEWTNGTIVGIDKILKTIWIMVSNLVYFIFAGVFIWIAFMNIIGKDGDTYQLKQALPRFIVGVLIVPFSWFFVQFVISASSILTAAVLSLPMSDEIYQSAKIEQTNNIPICTKGRTIYTGDQKTLDKVSGDKEGAGEGYVVICEGKKNGNLSELLQGNGIYSIMYYYTFAVMKFDDYGKVFSGDIGAGINSIVALIFKLGFSIIFIIIYAILIIALGMALFIRGVRFWIFAMFSPVFGLFYFFKKDGGGDGAAKNFSVKNFLSLAMVPVYVSGALVFGLVFIMVAGKGITENKLIQKVGDKTLIQTPFNDNDATKIYLKGTIHNENSPDAIDDFQTNFGTLAMQIFGIMFLWMGVMAALKSSEITGEVVDPIAKFGSSIGDLMKKMPTYAPIFPGGLSAQAMQKVGTIPQNVLEKRVADKVSTIQQKADGFFGTSTIPPGDIANIKNAMRDGINGNDELKKLQQELRKMGETYGTNSSQYQNLLKEFNQKLKESPSFKGYAKDSDKIFDNTGKLTDDGVRLLYDNDYDKNSSQSAINSGYARNIWQKGGKTPETPAAPGSGGQKIKITTNDPSNINQEITINVIDKDGKKQLEDTSIEALKKGAGKYKEADFRTAILNPIKGIDDIERERIIGKLKEIGGFFTS